jgi:hypothetical protein
MAMRDAWAADAALLAQIGQALSKQPTKIRVVLPRQLADAAVAAWERDDNDVPLAADANRDAAASLALIGLSITETGEPDGDRVSADLDAWFVGDALRAADRAGLL